MVHLSVDHRARPDLQVTPMRADHLARAHDLSRALQWPYRLEDWAFALDLGEGLVVEHEGALLGTALWWPYGKDFASVGMVIVAPEARRQGIGGLLMKALLARTGERRVVLNSTQDGFPLYVRLGFEAHGAVHQHQAVLARAPGRDHAIRPLVPEDRASLFALDHAASGMERGALIDALGTVGRISVLEREGRVDAYGVLRVWGRGVVIGPVVARDQADAKAMIATLAAQCEGRFTRIDVTLASGLSPWLESIGLPRVDEVVAMARGGAPVPADGAAVFALSNQSLG
jgi:GNAT superfamily N-acetyltransferase